jgi:hypothetical protein
MNPEKTKEHEPTAVKKRTWNLVEPSQHPTDTGQVHNTYDKGNCSCIRNW